MVTPPLQLDLWLQGAAQDPWHIAGRQCRTGSATTARRGAGKEETSAVCVAGCFFFFFFNFYAVRIKSDGFKYGLNFPWTGWFWTFCSFPPWRDWDDGPYQGFLYFWVQSTNQVDWEGSGVVRCSAEVGGKPATHQRAPNLQECWEEVGAQQGSMWRPWDQWKPWPWRPWSHDWTPTHHHCSKSFSQSCQKPHE